MSLPTKKMSPKKGMEEMEGYFYHETHMKCAGTITFILLRSATKYQFKKVLKNQFQQEILS